MTVPTRLLKMVPSKKYRELDLEHFTIRESQQAVIKTNVRNTYILKHLPLKPAMAVIDVPAIQFVLVCD